MRGAAGFLIVAAAFGFAGAAPAQSDLEGLYIAEIRETASALDLQAGGRFRWAFTHGGLDLLAEGRWRAAEDGAVVLDTEPPVESPRFELIETGREEGASALVVRIVDERGQVPTFLAFLTIEAEDDSGGPANVDLVDDAYRLEPMPGRRIVAIRAGSRAFRFWSELYAVPADANSMRLRFTPGDLGRADFRGTRATVDGDALLLPVLGEPIRYRRLSAEERSEYDGVIADIAAEAGAGPAPEESRPIEAIRIDRPVEVAIGEPLHREIARALPDHGDNLYATLGPVASLGFRHGGRRIDLGPVGGGDNLLFAVTTDPASRQVVTLAFAYQDRLLTLDEALARARGLEHWLRESGFEVGPAAEGRAAPFEVTLHARDGDPASVQSGATVRGSDWDSAARLLSDAAAGIVTMHLFTLEAGEVLASVLIENDRQLAARFGAPLAPPRGDGREWLLSATITGDPTALRRHWLGEE